VAAADEGDPRHIDCRQLLERQRAPLLVPVLVISEVAYLLQRAAGSLVELRFIADVTEGTYEPLPVDPIDWVRIAELGMRYRDLPLGTVDASVVAAAERLKVTQIATLDRRHFSVVRPSHIEAFELLP
jgi:predicted nucleic acid-binding protein